MRALRPGVSEPRAMLLSVGTTKGKVPGHVRDGVVRRARPGQSISERMPEFALDWDYELNGATSPNMVAWKSQLRAAWRCRRCGLRTERTIAGKAWTYVTTGPRGGCRSRSCAQLPRDMPQAGDSMRARFDSDLVGSFDIDGNAPHTPDTISYGSKRVFTWRCLNDDSHPVYVRSLPSRRKRGCPACESLDSTHPEIAAQWHPTRNGDLRASDVTRGSGARVWWRCSKQHEWRTSVGLRTNQGTGCPDCCLTHRSRMEVQLWAELVAVLTPELGAGTVRRNVRLEGVDARRGRIDIFIEAGDRSVAVEYDGAYWHRTRNAADLRKSEAIRGAGYNLIRVRETPLTCGHSDDISVAVSEPVQLASLVLQRMIERCWLDDAAAGAAKAYVKSSKPLGAQLAEELLSDVAYRDLGEESLEETHPNLAAEWDQDANGELTPRHVTAERHTPVWWRCQLGDSYQATPSDRARRGRGCPYCRGKKVNRRNCLATRFPDLAAQLTETNPFTPWEIYGGGHKKVQWRCPIKACRYVWTTEVKQRTQVDTGCPACAGKIATPARNLLTERPDVALIWHPTRNLPLTPDQVLPGCNSPVVWLCPDCVKPFPGTVVDRCSAAHQCCSECARRRSRRHAHRLPQDHG